MRVSRRVLFSTVALVIVATEALLVGDRRVQRFGRSVTRFA